MNFEGTIYKKAVEGLSDQERRDFLNNHIFHERQMNSCPIGCVGCAVKADTSNIGALAFADLQDVYKDAQELGVELKITKVEGYDPVFVRYVDDSGIPFAKSVKTAVDHGHQIITPICTTGSWKSDRTIWQLDALGKLDNKYREYKYPSGNGGTGFVLSVPREIRPFADDKYDFDTHIEKVVKDIELLTQNGDLDVLIYYNSKVDGDFDFAVKIKEFVSANIKGQTRERAKLIVTDFNAEVMPESCMRYENSILFSDRGFNPIDPVILEWDVNKNGIRQDQQVSI